MRQLVELQDLLPRLQERGYRTIAISRDDPGHAAEVASDHGLAFSVVSDEGLTLTRKFGIVFQAPDQDPLPVPAVYLVDGEGTVTFHFVHPDYKIRLNPELLLAAASLQPGRRPEGH
ncbi:MAG: peroxiredoxin family protein [Acidobacteria bacterium]|jgi:peroxiredoxin|nr:peroxiredoxin family protein [Acidobacteriota bacterium]